MKKWKESKKDTLESIKVSDEIINAPIDVPPPKPENFIKIEPIPTINVEAKHSTKKNQNTLVKIKFLNSGNIKPPKSQSQLLLQVWKSLL